MATFQPLAPSLGGGFPAADPHVDADPAADNTPPTTESAEMAEPSIRDRILTAIKEAGGTITSRALSEALEDIPVANRRYHAQQLAKQGLIAVSGTTIDRAYSLPGVKPKASKKASNAKKVAKSKPEEVADEGMPAARDPWKFARTEPNAAPVEQPTPGGDIGIQPAHLKRLLALVLRSDSELTRPDRDALAAVAAGC